MSNEFKCTSVFERNLAAYVDKSNLIINQGGTRSSKSYSIMQLLLLIAINSKKRLIISVCSYALPHLKLGVMRDFDTILMSYGINVGSVKNITESTYKIGNSLIEFFGVDNLGKVHGPARDILFLNECNYVKHEIFEQLAIRTRSTIFLDYNPSREFWAHTDVIPKLPHVLIKSTYRDNEFLTSAQIGFIESKKTNSKWWRVYGEGELGQLEGAVFEGWTFGEFPENLQYCFGQDFGFCNDPTTLVKVAVDKKNKKIYCQEYCYKAGLTTSQIGQINSINAVNALIVADNSEPRLIHELKNQYRNNIIPCVKGKGSIAADLIAMQDYQLVITEDSPNLAKELNYYTWVDKKGQLVIDDYNHLIDAIRYAFAFLNKPQLTGGRWAK